MSDRFTKDALDAQLRKLPELAPEEAHIGAVAKQGGDIGVEAEGSKYVGKGWSLAGTFEWMKNTGWATVAGVAWKGKPK